LAKAGFDVTIVAQHVEDDIVDGVKIRALPIVEGRLRRMSQTVWGVLRESLRQDADIYHFHDPELIPVGLALSLQGKKVIYDVHEDLPNDILLKQYVPKWSRWTLSQVFRALESLAGRRLSALVTVSPSIAQRLLEYNPRTILVRNYSDPRELEPAIDSPWSARANAVAFAGGILPERGIRQMVQAMGLLRDPWTATLEIASADFPEEMKKELSNDPGWQRVRHLGKLNRVEIRSLYSRVRAGLVVYLPEAQNMNAMPHKLFEYMAAGIPVIASDFARWREILKEVNCALFVNPLRPEEIAEAIEYVLRNPGEAAEMGRRGQKAVKESFNWETQAQNLVELYRGLMEPVCAA